MLCSWYDRVFVEAITGASIIEYTSTFEICMDSIISNARYNFFT
jgi:hypothetical protein